MTPLVQPRQLSNRHELAASDPHRWKLEPRLLHILFWTGASAIGALQAWSARHSMNADGISYLEVANAYMQADWNLAINSFWSPLYSWLIAVAMYLLKPSAYWEFPVIHLVNFSIYLLGLASFTFLLRELIHYAHRSDAVFQRYACLPDWAWLVIGYSLFMWSSLDFSNLAFVTPDGCVAALVYVVAGLLVRIKRKKEASNLGLFVFLGLALGLAYLAKTPMFLLAFVFLAISIWPLESPRRSLFCLAIAFVAFFLVAGPFITAVSISKGRLTFGDMGKWNYAVFVSRVKIFHRHAENPVEGVAQHPTRKIFPEPAVYEFVTPNAVTYAPWYDPSHGIEGLKIQFHLADQIRRSIAVLQDYYDIVSDQVIIFIGLMIGWIILCWMGWETPKLSSKHVIYWQLVVPASAAFVMYALVYIQPRYIAPFVVLFWLGMFSTVILPASVESKKLVTCISIVIFALVIIKMVVPTLEMVYVTARDLVKPQEHSGTAMWAIADGLRRRGIQAEDKVAIIGWGPEDARWARLARVKIIAEIPSYKGWGFSEGDKFWRANERIKSQVYQALAQTGAKVIVASVPDSVPSIGWQKIGNTTYSARFLH
jgi:hypothetical protein